MPRFSGLSEVVPYTDVVFVSKEVAQSQGKNLTCPWAITAQGFSPILRLQEQQIFWKP